MRKVKVCVIMEMKGSKKRKSGGAFQGKAAMALPKHLNRSSVLP